MSSLRENIEIIDKCVDKEGNVSNQKKYQEANDEIKEEMLMILEEDFNELRDEIKELKTLLKKHQHMDAKVVVEV